MSEIKVRIKVRVSRKARLMFEVGIAVLAVILFLGALSSITATYKTLIIDTKDLLNTTVTVAYYGYNSTSGKWFWIGAKTYNVSDIATLYDDWLYLSIPYDISVENISDYGFAFIEFSLPYTHRELAEMGMNLIEFLLKADGQVIDANDGKTLVQIGVVKAIKHPDWWVYYNPYVYENTTIDVNGNITIDTANYMLWITSNNIHNVQAAFGFRGDVFTSKTVMLKLNIYAVSKKPVLKALVEPVYSFFAAMWSAMLGIIRRVKSVVASAFGGFSISALFTGLIGDPVTALIITIFMVTIFFLIMKSRRR